MWHPASVARPRRTSLSRLSLFVLALTLGYAGAARADTWKPGDLITWNQASWGDTPTSTNAAGLLLDNYDAVYASSSGVFEVGISGSSGFSMLFTSAVNLQTYLPSSGVIGPLVADLTNPTSSSSGAFGGEVAALKINIDFSNAGFLLGTSGIPFGNLVLANFSTLPALNGLTVRQFLAIDNTLLGGGSVTGFSIADLDPVTVDLNASFGGGQPNTFAQNNLVAPTTAPVPEPGTLLLLGTGLLGVVGAARRKWLG